MSTLDSATRLLETGTAPNGNGTVKNPMIRLGRVVDGLCGLGHLYAAHVARRWASHSERQLRTALQLQLLLDNGPSALGCPALF